MEAENPFFDKVKKYWRNNWIFRSVIFGPILFLVFILLNFINGNDLPENIILFRLFVYSISASLLADRIRYYLGYSNFGQPDFKLHWITSGLAAALIGGLILAGGKFIASDGIYKEFLSELFKNTFIFFVIVLAGLKKQKEQSIS